MSDRDAYEASLGTPPRELAPPGLLGHEWRGTGSGVAGDAVVSRGELVLDDRPFDDTGADTRPGNGPVVQEGVDAATVSGLCGPGSAYATGDTSYPAGDAYGPRNAADLVQVRVALTRERVHVLWQLQSVVDPATVAVGLLLDTDADPTTGSAEGFPGAEQVLVVGSDFARGAGLSMRYAVDARANTVEASFPRAELPARGPWRVNAVAGLRGGYELGQLMDAAHVPDEPVLQARACRLDEVQSARLATKQLPGALLDPARLTRGASDPAAVRRGGFTRHYLPRLQLGEGVVGQARYGQASSASVYRGTVQPYAVYVPSTYDASSPAPLLLVLHCLTCWHTVFSIASFPGLGELAEQQGAIVVTPFGYGEGGHYEAEAQTDVFEVLSDVSRRYRVDPERITLSGMSMGSLGAYRIGLSHPDLFARLLLVASYTTPFCVTPDPRVDCGAAPFNYLSMFPNARALPVAHVQGLLDELAPSTANRYFADEWQRLGYRYRYWELATRTHDPELHGLTTDLYGPWLEGARVERSPATVTYVLDRLVHEPAQLPDRAYWLRDLRLADGVRTGRVDATTGRGAGFATTPVSGSGQGAAGPWTLRGLDGVPVPATGRNELRVVSTGFTSASVDLATARLTRAEPLTVTVETDRPLRLVLGAAVLDVPAGTTTRVLPPAGPRGAASAPLGRQLPATGDDLPWLGGLLVLGATAAARSRRGRAPAG